MATIYFTEMCDVCLDRSAAFRTDKKPGEVVDLQIARITRSVHTGDIKFKLICIHLPLPEKP